MPPQFANENPPSRSRVSKNPVDVKNINGTIELTAVPPTYEPYIRFALVSGGNGTDCGRTINNTRDNS